MNEILAATQAFLGPPDASLFVKAEAFLREAVQDLTKLDDFLGALQATTDPATRTLLLRSIGTMIQANPSELPESELDKLAKTLLQDREEPSRETLELVSKILYIVLRTNQDSFRGCLHKWSALVSEQMHPALFTLLVQDVQDTEGSFAAEHALFTFETKFLPDVFELSLRNILEIAPQSPQHLHDQLSLLHACLSYNFAGTQRIAKKRTALNIPEQIQIPIHPMLEEQQIWMHLQSDAFYKAFFAILEGLVTSEGEVNSPSLLTSLDIVAQLCSLHSDFYIVERGIELATHLVQLVVQFCSAACFKDPQNLLKLLTILASLFFYLPLQHLSSELQESIFSEAQSVLLWAIPIYINSSDFVSEFLLCCLGISRSVPSADILNPLLAQYLKSLFNYLDSDPGEEVFTDTFLLSCYSSQLAEIIGSGFLAFDAFVKHEVEILDTLEPISVQRRLAGLNLLLKEALQFCKPAVTCVSQKGEKSEKPEQWLNLSDPLAALFSANLKSIDSQFTLSMFTRLLSRFVECYFTQFRTSPEAQKSYAHIAAEQNCSEEVLFDRILLLFLQNVTKSHGAHLLESLIELFEHITSLTYKDMQGIVRCGNIEFSEDARAAIQKAHLEGTFSVVDVRYQRRLYCSLSKIFLVSDPIDTLDGYYVTKFLSPFQRLHKHSAHTLPRIMNQLAGILESLSNQMHFKIMVIFLENNGFFKLIKKICLDLPQSEDLVGYFIEMLHPLLKLLLELTLNRYSRIENSYVANSQLLLLVTHACELICMALPPMADYPHYSQSELINVKYKAVNESCLLFCQIAPYLKNKATVQRVSPQSLQNALNALLVAIRSIPPQEVLSCYDRLQDIFRFYRKFFQDFFKYVQAFSQDDLLYLFSFIKDGLFHKHQTIFHSTCEVIRQILTKSKDKCHREHFELQRDFYTQLFSQFMHHALEWTFSGKLSDSAYLASLMHDIVEMDIVDVELIVKKAGDVIPSLKQEKALLFLTKLFGERRAKKTFKDTYQELAKFMRT